MIWQQLGELLDRQHRQRKYAPRKPRAPRSPEAKLSRNRQASAVERNRELIEREKAWEVAMTIRIAEMKIVIREENDEYKRLNGCERNAVEVRQKVYRMPPGTASSIDFS